MLSKNTKTFPLRELDLNLENDRRIVREFEKELNPFEGKSLVVMRGTPYLRELQGFELYLHENGIFRYSEQYPLGGGSRRRSDAHGALFGASGRSALT